MVTPLTPEEVMNLVNGHVEIGWPFKVWGAFVMCELVAGSDDFEFRFGFSSVPERDTGVCEDGTQCRSRVSVARLCESGRDGVLDFVQNLIEGALLHELNESILVDGLRVFDPHEVVLTRQVLAMVMTGVGYPEAT